MFSKEPYPLRGDFLEQQTKIYFLHYKTYILTSLSRSKKWDLFAFSRKKIDFSFFDTSFYGHIFQLLWLQNFKSYQENELF
jgi:hypothetical protein